MASEKLSEISTTITGNALSTDLLYLVRGDGGSPEVFTSYRITVDQLPGGSTPSYDMRFAFSGTPTASQVLDTIPLPRQVVLPADMTGSVGLVGTNPTASFVIDVQDDAASIGSITIATDGTVTFSTASGAAQTIAAGSVLTFVAPATTDATIANGTFTLLGSA